MGTAGRRILIGTVVLVVLAVIGAGGALAAGLLRPPTPDYRVAEVALGDVSEVVDLTGSVTRVNQASATFPTAGTVTWSGVEIGRRVTKGEPMARIEKLPLQVELVKAEAELTQARAAYQQDLKAAEDAAKQEREAEEEKEENGPTESGATESGSTAGGSDPGGSAAPPKQKKPKRSARNDPSSGGGAAVALQQLMVRLTAQMERARNVCTLKTPTPPVSPSRSISHSASPTPSSPPPSQPQPPSSPSPSSPPPSQSPSSPNTPSPPPSQSPSSPNTPTAKPTPPSDSTVKIRSCLAALGTVTATQATAAGLLNLASAELTAATAQLSAAAEAQAKAMAEAAELQAEQQAEAMAQAQAEMLAQATSGDQTASGSTGATKAQLAQDLVAITRAQQAVDKARDDLAGATLRAPITGVVGSVDFTEGSVASAASGITVVGSGASEVTVRVPLSLMGKVAVGQSADVVPPGGIEPIRGEVTTISLLPSSASGGNTAYDTAITVRRSPVALTTGVAATVRIVVAAAADVPVLPMSATIPIDENRATVRVLRSGSIEEVTVTTGVKGVTRIEIVDGLTVGQQVVIADPTKPLPGLDLFGGGEEPPPDEESTPDQPAADSGSEPAPPEPTR